MSTNEIIQNVPTQKAIFFRNLGLLAEVENLDVTEQVCNTLQLDLPLLSNIINKWME